MIMNEHILMVAEWMLC